MTRDELLEYGRLVKVLDPAIRVVPDVWWPLCFPAVEILHEVEDTRYPCPMCHSVVNSHRCDCPVKTASRGLRVRRGSISCR